MEDYKDNERKFWEEATFYIKYFLLQIKGYYKNTV